MSSDCEGTLTCWNFNVGNFCLSEEVFNLLGNDCTDSNECKAYGSEIAECRNMMCSMAPAVPEGEVCFYGYECDEGLDCFYYGEGQLCLAKDVPLNGACSVMD